MHCLSFADKKSSINLSLLLSAKIDSKTYTSSLRIVLILQFKSYNPPKDQEEETFLCTFFLNHHLPSQYPTQDTFSTNVCAQKSASWYFNFLLTLPGLNGVAHDIFLSPVAETGEVDACSPMAKARWRFGVGVPNLRLAEQEMSIMNSPS